MPILRSIALLGTLAFLALVPAPLSARCRPSVGYRLAPIGTTATAPGANVLLALENVYDRSQVIASPGTVTLRRASCTTRCTVRIALQPLANNLAALPLPASLAPGRYQIVELRTSIDVAPVAAASALTAAPVLAPTPFGEVMVGTGTTSPTIELATVPPAAVGMIARWGTTSWFMRLDGSRTRGNLARQRCSTPVPGRGALSVGDAIELTFVDANGGMSPAARLTSTVALPE